MLIPGRKSRGEFCSELKEHSELCDWNEELKAPVIFEWNGNFCINIIFWINGFLKLPPPWRLFCWIAKIHQSRSSLRSFFIYSNLAKRYATGDLTFIIKHPLRFPKLQKRFQTATFLCQNIYKTVKNQLSELALRLCMRQRNSALTITLTII